MNRHDLRLRSDERIAYALRELYENLGYSRFKMGKFEEYELYLRNKDFLSGERMITFTDADGTLLALKPDVTISIIRSTREGDKELRKVYYHETVYRTGRGEQRFREIMQTGLECVGALDDYQVFEVISLAVRSLALISPDYRLSLSHMGLLSGLMTQAGVEEDDFPLVLACIRGKNAAELLAFCRDRALSEEARSLLRLLVDTYGRMDEVLAILEPYCTGMQARAALAELGVMARLLKAADLEARVCLDFSVVNDMGYYNGIVFQGFVKGLADGVLSGGRYDKLVEKMGKQSGAIGFAIGLNDLERLDTSARDFDVDLLLLYDETTDLTDLMARALQAQQTGQRVMVQRQEGTRLMARAVLDLREGGEKL